MKKTLIVPVVAAMLAVSCGSDPTPVKDWSKEIKDFMTAELGEVLPYMELDEASLVYAYGSDSYGGMFYAYDDNETNLVATYGEKLVAAGYELDATAGSYFKETSISNIEIQLAYYEAEGEPGEEGYVAPGNQISVGYLYVEEPAGEWKDADFKALMTEKLTEFLPYMPLDVVTDDFHFGESTKMSGFVFGAVERNETISYGLRLANAGYYYSEDLEAFFKPLDDRIIVVEFTYIDPEEAASYGYDSALVEIDFSLRYVDLNYFPSTEIATYYLEELDETIPVPELISENTTSYSYDENVDQWGTHYADVYCYGTTTEELKSYVSALINVGWLVSDYGEDAYLFLPGTNMRCTVFDYHGYEDPDDPYTAWISFYDVEATVYPDNTSTAYTIAHELGLESSEVKDMTAEGAEYKSYAILYSFKDMTLDEANTFVKSIVGAVDGYFFSEEMSKVEYDEENPEVVVAYLNYYLIDEYEEGGQYVFFALFPDDENVGQIGMNMEISGKPVEKIWGAQEVLLKLINESAIGSVFKLGAEDISDYSEQAGFPYFQIAGSYYWPEQYLETIKYYWNGAVSGTLKDFKTDQTKYLTREVELSDGSTTTQYYVQYSWTSRDGTHKVIVEFNFFVIEGTGVFPSVVAYEVPANPETPAENA